MTYLAALAACLLIQAPAAHVETTTPAPSDSLLPGVLAGPLADLRPLEVRIRKLYLVRPDLLQFPIPYDVIC